MFIPNLPLSSKTEYDQQHDKSGSTLSTESPGSGCHWTAAPLIDKGGKMCPAPAPNFSPPQLSTHAAHFPTLHRTRHLNLQHYWTVTINLKIFMNHIQQGPALSLPLGGLTGSEVLLKKWENLMLVEMTESCVGLWWTAFSSCWNDIISNLMLIHNTLTWWSWVSMWSKHSLGLAPSLNAWSPQV